MRCMIKASPTRTGAPGKTRTCDPRLRRLVDLSFNRGQRGARNSIEASIMPCGGRAAGMSGEPARIGSPAAYRPVPSFLPPITTCHPRALASSGNQLTSPFEPENELAGIISPV